MTTDLYAAIRGCRSKNRYATEDLARHVAEIAFQKRGHVLRVYSCEECGGYHLTHVDAARTERNYRPARKSARQEAQEKNRKRDWNKRRTR